MPGTTQSISDDPVRDERFRLGIEGSGLGTWDLDLSTKELIWSATTRRLFGYSDKDPVSYDLFLSLLEPGDRERTQQAIDQLLGIDGGLTLDRQQPRATRPRLHSTRARVSTMSGNSPAQRLPR